MVIVCVRQCLVIRARCFCVFSARTSILTISKKIFYSSLNVGIGELISEARKGDGSKFLIKLKGSFLGMLKFDPRLMICIYCSIAILQRF